MHPAFKLGDTELTGIWVAKFEASSSKTEDGNSNLGGSYGSNTKVSISIGGNEVTIRPNVTSWRAIDVSKCYEACINMIKANNTHGLLEEANKIQASQEADSHLMKDTEWGAVAYLTQSAYGNAQISSTTGVWNNCYYEGDGYYTTKTGMVGIRVEENGSKIANPMSNPKYYRDNESKYNSVKTDRKVNVDGSITISYQKTGNTDTYTNTYYTYETENGVKGSTTGTIYGIYDMAGGAWEYQASYLSGIDTSGTETAKKMVDYFNTYVPAKHKITYAGTSEDRTANDNLEANKAQYGNALWEILNGAAGGNSWNSDYLYFVYATYPFVLRGGHFNDSSISGLFSFTRGAGGTSASFGFRPVLVAL